MKYFIFLSVSCLFLGFNSDDFLKNQKKNLKVKSAYNEKFNSLNLSLKKRDIDIGSLNLIIVAFKNDCRIDVYAKNRLDKKYIKFREYKICERSGVLGPKRKEGDLQVPEGYYYINHFNPESNYYLSLGINYPNQSDKIKSDSKKPGGAIYIHGDCVTVGCLPVTDEKIKEIYVLTCQAYASGQIKIPVYIFPYEMTPEKNAVMKKKYNGQFSLIEFWENISLGYNRFIRTNSEINYSVNSKGNYVFND